MKAALVALVVAALSFASGRADAYPQFELSKDQACSGCHLAPAGGGPLSENGLAVAEQISKFGTAPEFMYGKVPLPSWLAVQGDLRYAYGYLQAPQRYLIGFPMQGDVYAVGTHKNVSVHVTAGIRPQEEDNEAATTVWSREHYVMYRSDPGGSEGLYARIGRFMPVFGQRFAEHTVYTRRYGGSQLYADTYAASVSYLKPNFEVHATGFIKDPLIDPVQTGNGGALYAEYGLAQNTWVGGGAKVEISDLEQRYRGTLTAKHYFPKPDLLLQAEVQLVNPKVEDYGYRQIVGYLMASYFPTQGLMVDVGLGHFDSNIRIKNLDRDCVDLNIHFFATSHFEAVLISRAEFFGFGSGGPTGAYAMLMGHYRL